MSKNVHLSLKGIVVSLLVIAGLFFQSTAVPAAYARQAKSLLQSDNPNHPDAVVKLIFIHHSTGQNWLDDGNGGLGLALSQNNYFVSDTNYGWGPNSIGDNTDIPNWIDWFRSDDTPSYMAALYAESEQHSSYTRTLADPGGENEIIMFKSCFPNSALSGNPNDPPSPDGWLTVGHAKYVYNEILQYFGAHPEKLFVVITAPPLSDATYAANARAFNQWLVNDWLNDNNYTLKNVAIFDFYNVLTGPDNHHRYYNGQIQHIFTPGLDTLYYPSLDDHPSQQGNLKATDEFIEVLNIFYHRWQDDLAAPPSISGCQIFPQNNIWNARIDNLPVHTLSSQWVNTIGRNTGFHMDFGSGEWDGGPIGIPYNIVDGSVPKVSVNFYYPEESDPGPYPIPSNPLIEYGSDHHILMLDSSTCELYEIYDASNSGGGWDAGSGAIWDLGSNVLRPDGWTSADAAGLPILPGLVRYDEIVSGEINHAIRFTAAQTNGYIWPARHLTSDDPSSPQIPPMGARFRLKASFDISGYPSAMQVILRAMKNYGIILADNGSNWYVSGAPDERWDNDMLHLLDDLTGDDFEAVDESWLMVDADSGEAQVALSFTFVDVLPNYWAFSWVERLYSAGITGGCAVTPSLRYCPDSNVTRAEMAVFLERGLHGADYIPPNVSPTFDDTNGHWAEDWIEALKADGITGGCSSNNYCPNMATTRAQMAIFLLRAKYGSAYLPPDATGTMFDDVSSGYWAAAWIEQLAVEGITSGCSSGNYCPDASVTRAQMAVFLVRTFNLP